MVSAARRPAPRRPATFTPSIYGLAAVGETLSLVKGDDAFWAILDEAVGAGPCDGGCLICARAIQAAFGGDIVHLARNHRPDHYGVRLAGGIVDFDGPTPSPRAWLERFVELEGVSGRVTFRPGFAPSSDIPDDRSAAVRLAGLIRSHRRAAGI